MRRVDTGARHLPEQVLDQDVVPNIGLVLVSAIEFVLGHRGAVQPCLGLRLRLLRSAEGFVTERDAVVIHERLHVLIVVLLVA